jgi:E3 ubiquitin-protein ligase MARCH6
MVDPRQLVLTVFRAPASDMPIDMLLITMGMPYVMRYIHPSQVLHPWTQYMWRIMVPKLRLSGYLIGQRFREEETHQVTWWSQIYYRKPVGETVPYGEYRRVPATDLVPLNPAIRLVVPVREDGTPADDATKRMLEAQDAVATTANRDPKEDFTVVHIPPWFRTRLLGLVALTWSSVCAALALVVSISTLFGRAMLSRNTSGPVHDGYAFMVGFCLIWIACTFGRALNRLDIRRQRMRDWEGPEASPALWAVKCALYWTGTITYMFIMLGVVIPVLFGLVVDFYVVLPVRLTINPAMPIRIRIVDTWMLGLLYCTMFCSARNIRQATDVGHGLNRVGGTVSCMTYID